MPMAGHMTRRVALAKGALAGAAAWLAVRGIARGEGSPPSERLGIAFVGAGGQAQFSLENLADQNIVGLCDVDDERAADAYKKFPKARKYTDYRRMLDELHNQIDAVVVATPDHIHAPASLMAMRMGKHVYCEKPLTWCIDEARRMAQVAREKKVATQMGTQGMAGDRSRAGIEVIRSGVLGTVRQMHVWTDRALGWWPQGVDRPKETPPVPAGLQWDLWLGPAPVRPYNPAYCPFKWRGWLDFGTGALGDMGIHNAAMPYRGLNLGLPTTVEVIQSSGANSETWPAWATLRYEFPARGDLAPVTMYWYDGGKKPSAELLGGREPAKNGAILVGDKGTLYSVEWTGGEWTLLPRPTFRDYQPPPPSLPRSPGHHKEWVAACKGGPAPFCNFPDFASPLTEVMLLGGLALRTGRKIEWDAQNMRAKNCPDADRFIRREYRKGWEA